MPACLAASTIIVPLGAVTSVPFTTKVTISR